MSVRSGGRESGRAKPCAMRVVMVAMALLAAGPAGAADTFPSRPIRIIVASGAGGGTDLTGRHVARTMSELLPHPVVVENRPGAGSSTGTDQAARATPDGYTLLVSSASSMVMNPILYKNLPYQPLRDFVAVGFIAAYPFVLITRADLPPASLAEFVKYAKERPGKLTYASPGVGTVQHVWGTILFKSLGLDLLHVPFKAAAAGHQEMLGGRIDAMFDNLSANRQYVESGRMKGLAVSTPKRASQLPGVPTVNETGLAQFEGESWMGMFAPAKTPPAVVRTLREVFVRVSRDADFGARIGKSGGYVMAVPPEEQQQFVRREIERWGKLIRQYGVTGGE
jgi:tripartite-type tricarboxylate transporter receptor subunit TctC